MEISLRKPQREVFDLIKKHPGSFLRTHKKSARRQCFRLMSKDLSPIKNITEGEMKPFFSLDLLQKVGTGEYSLKSDLVLVEKKSKS